MSDPRLIAEAMEDESRPVVLNAHLIDIFVQSMEEDYGPNWRDVFDVAEDVVSEAKKKPGKSKKTVVSQKQLSFFRMIAKGPPRKVRVKDPTTGQVRMKNVGHSAKSWAKIVARLPKDSNMSDPATAVKVARKVLKDSGMPVNPETGKKFSPKASGLPQQSATRYATYKRRRRGTEAAPTLAPAPVAEGVNTYVPVDDDFAKRLKEALGG